MHSRLNILCVCSKPINIINFYFWLIRQRARQTVRGLTNSSTFLQNHFVIFQKLFI